MLYTYKCNMHMVERGRGGRETDFRVYHWPYRERWESRIWVYGRCNDLERSKAWTRPPPATSRESGGQWFRCYPSHRWTPTTPSCSWQPERTESPLIFATFTSSPSNYTITPTVQEFFFLYSLFNSMIMQGVIGYLPHRKSVDCSWIWP